MPEWSRPIRQAGTANLDGDGAVFDRVSGIAPIPAREGAATVGRDDR